MKELAKQITTECLRIEEDAEQSAKRHFNAATRWSHYNYWIGIPSVIVAAIGSAVSFASWPVVGGILAATTGALTAILTFLKPSERATAHTTAGNQYLRLRNETRVFREIDLPQLAGEDLAEKFKPFAQRRDDLNDSSPTTEDGDYQKANQGILDGQTEYRADKNDRK